MRITFIYLSIFFFPTFAGCQSNVECKSNLERMIIRNSNYEYNCGLEAITLKKSEELNYICNEFERLERVYPISTNYNRGYLQIILEPSENIFFNDAITLIFTHNNGFIFQTYGVNYKNDELANFLIKKLKITNVYSDKICQ